MEKHNGHIRICQDERSEFQRGHKDNENRVAIEGVKFGERTEMSRGTKTERVHGLILHVCSSTPSVFPSACEKVAVSKVETLVELLEDLHERTGSGALKPSASLMEIAVLTLCRSPP